MLLYLKITSLLKTGYDDELKKIKKTILYKSFIFTILQ